MNLQDFNDRKIIKWFKKLCFACVSCNYEMDEGDYSTTGSFYCDSEHPASNLSFFPNMEAPKNCNNFIPNRSEEIRGEWFKIMWDLEGEDVETEEAFKIAHNIIDFNERMGNYKNRVLW